MSILIKNIKELVQVDESGRLLVKGKEMAELETVKNAFLFVEEEKIADYGCMIDFQAEKYDAEVVIDATGKMVFPCFVDSHTHLVYPKSREIEYIDKIKGLSYEEIAKRGRWYTQFRP